MIYGSHEDHVTWLFVPLFSHNSSTYYSQRNSRTMCVSLVGGGYAITVYCVVSIATYPTRFVQAANGFARQHQPLWVVTQKDGLVSWNQDSKEWLTPIENSYSSTGSVCWLAVDKNKMIIIIIIIINCTIHSKHILVQKETGRSKNIQFTLPKKSAPLYDCKVNQLQHNCIQTVQHIVKH